MTRLSPKQYGRRTMAAMTVYVALMLLVWPHVRDASDLGTKVLLALVPVLPMLYVVWLMARKIFGSDELEQRTHLIGLAAATGASAVFSLICGFLAAAHMFDLDSVANLMFWVFPVQMFSYGIVRWWAARRYGTSSGCGEEEDGIPMYLRFLMAGTLLALTAVWSYLHKADPVGLSLLGGMATALLGFAIIFGFRRWQRRGTTHADP